jgi:hypothetical protein
MILDLINWNLAVACFTLGIMLGILTYHIVTGFLGKIFYKLTGPLDNKLNLHPIETEISSFPYIFETNLQAYAIVQFVNKRWGALLVRDIVQNNDYHYVEHADGVRISGASPNEVKYLLQQEIKNAKRKNRV